MLRPPSPCMRAMAAGTPTRLTRCQGLLVKLSAIIESATCSLWLSAEVWQEPNLAPPRMHRQTAASGRYTSGSCTWLSRVHVVGLIDVYCFESFRGSKNGRSARRKGRAGPPLCMPFMHNGHCPRGPLCQYPHVSFNGARPALHQQQLQRTKQVRCKTWPALQGSMPSHCR